MDEKYSVFQTHLQNCNLTAIELELLLTEKCNLNCIGYCSEGGPGKASMSDSMLDAVFMPFSTINTLKLLGGEPSIIPHHIEYVYDIIERKGIVINELWLFTNGYNYHAVDRMCDILIHKPKTVGTIYLYVSRGYFHNRAIINAGHSPQEVDDSFERIKAKYGRTFYVEKQWDEKKPINVGHARELTNNPIEVSLDTRNLVLFGENRVQRLVFSPNGYERPEFCNPEDVQELSFGHLIADGMDKILLRGLRLTDMDDNPIEY